MEILEKPTFNSSNQKSGLRSGDTIINGKYTIRRLVGTGAFGEVYEAHDNITDSICAIKVLRSDLSNDPQKQAEAQKRSDTEKYLGPRIKKFKNPFIIANDTVEIDDQQRIYLIMEYVPGNLRKKIDQANEDGKPIPVETAVQWTIECAEGLQALHRMNVVHRDIKPSNILIAEEDNHVRVADLGLCQVDNPSSVYAANGHPRTDEYCPPEQEEGQTASLRPSADIYALGCVLFELLTGQMYFKYKGRQGTTARALRPDTPVWLDKIIRRMLAPEQKDRYVDGTEIAHLLEERLRWWLWWRKNRARLICLTAGMIIVGLLIYGGAFFQPEIQGFLARQATERADTSTALSLASTATRIPNVTQKPSATPRQATRVPAIIVTITPTNTSTPTKTITITPQRTNTPTLSPTKNLDPTLYDNFNNASFDGSYNHEIWSDSSGGLFEVKQLNGSLVFTNHSSPEGGDFQLRLRKRENIQIDKLGFFEAKLKIGNGYIGAMAFVKIQISATLSNNDGWWTQCRLENPGTGSAPYFLCDVYTVQNEKLIVSLYSVENTW